jgi:hypothetical protein
MMQPIRLILASLLVVCLASVPEAAQADRLAGPEETEVDELPLRAEIEHLTLQTLREPMAPDSEGVEAGAEAPEIDQAEGTDAGEPPPSEAGSDSIAAAPPGSMLSGLAPWRFFDGVVNEATCRAPRWSADGYAALAICAGLDRRNPRAQFVVVRVGRGVYRYTVPVAEGVEAVADLSTDGQRFAVLVSEGGGLTVHLVDLAQRQDHRIAGGWREPGNPKIAGAAATVAFVAQVGGKEAVVVVSLEQGKAWRTWREGSKLRVDRLSEDGGRVLLAGKSVDLLQSWLVDVERAVRFEISGRKGDVVAADLHASGEAVVFSSSVGGVCAVWWADLTTRRRIDLFSSVEHCYGRVQLESNRRLVLYEAVHGRATLTHLWDRKKREIRLSPPARCQRLQLTDDGLFLAGRCSIDERGAGLFVLPVPEEAR